MRCPRCRHDNAAQSRFCAECGARLALTYVSWLEFQLGDRAAAARSAERLLALIHAHGFQPWLGYATVLNRVCGGEPLTIDALRELYRRFGELPTARLRRTFCVCLLAELCADLGHPELGRQFTALLGKVDRGAMYAPELLRVEGELIARAATPDPAQAERSYREAIELARSRATKSFELRAAMSLARLWRGQGKKREARELLAPLYGWFTEGLQTADLRAAKALLAELA